MMSALNRRRWPGVIYSTFSRLTNRIAKAVITGSYRRSATAWKVGEEGERRKGNDRFAEGLF